MDDVARSTTYPYPSDAITLPPSSRVDAPQRASTPAKGPEIPSYLQDTYYWCYLNPRNVQLLDREFVVRTILWQQHRKLQKLAFAEIQPGQSVLQPASVYGSFAPNLAAHIGPEGSLDVVDVAAVQVRSVGSKLREFPNARVHHTNILDFAGRPFDVVCCYFLLHEVPDDYKFKIVNLLLEKVNPGGKVVFVDYHKPRWWHPLKLITSIVFDTLEPFAKRLWRSEIQEFANEPGHFSWHKETIFAGLFQKVVATRMD
ncbi:MAG: rhodoquinone biosynthesis methyltransferase RquA [Xanthomonadales bacterium]|jgi:ubiquinone/menaquinone biosynthesis C-methylase UbiE|nr:rhodoquinone biosynthesis methyltransferase RquA [Xanthomonadales bacterium]